MKTRYFSLFEKIRIIYSNFFMVFGTIWSIPTLFVILGFNAEIGNNIALYNSTTYTDGTDIKIAERRVKNNLYYDHTLAYVVADKSYEVIFSNSTADSIKEKVKVKYLAKDPAISTAEELFISNIIGTMLLLSIFPLVGVAFLVYGIKKSSQNLDVLENGEIAFGKFLRSEATNTTINKQTVMKLYFSFTDKYGKEQQTVAETHNTEKLQDEALEMLVYMPDNVEKSVFLDILPSFVRKRLEPEFVKLKSKAL